MIRAIAFDAVGTLIHPDPPAAEIYAAVGQRFGSRLDARAIGVRFRQAFARQEQKDRAAGLRTDERREIERWRDIVAEVLDDVNVAEACFAVLYEHFAQPWAWRTSAGAASVLAQLGARGFRLALASNYDQRLRRVVAGMPEFAAIEHLVISSEVGWRKPAPQFFAALCRNLELPARDVLLVGDDRDNDFEGGMAAGLQTLLFDRCGRSLDLGPRRIGTLEELLFV